MCNAEPEYVGDFKKHPLFPFADFRTNDESFLLLELFWTQVIREAIGEELAQKCEPLQQIQRDNMDYTYYDPTMVDFWIPEMDRGGRVVLTENPYDFPYYADAVGEQRFWSYYPFLLYLEHHRYAPDGEHEFVQLVCQSDLSDEGVAGTQRFMREFLVNKASESSIEDLIKKQVKDAEERYNYPTEAEWKAFYDRQPSFSTGQEWDAYYRKMSGRTEPLEF